MLASLTVYAHYLFGVMFLVHAVYAFWPRRPEGPVSRQAFCAALGTAVVLALPMAPQLLSLMGRAASLSFAPEPSILDFLRRLWPIMVLLGLLLVRRRSWEEAFAARSADLALMVTWSVTPTMVLFVVSWLTPAKLFVPRYYAVATAPGTALLIAWAIRTMRSARTRMVIITGAAVWLGLSTPYPETSSGWRAAAAAVRSVRGDAETPVLVYSELIESRQIEWLEDKEKSSYLLSPVAFYPIGGAAIPLPWSVEGDAATYLEGIAKTRLEQHGRFVLVAATATKFRTWFDRRMQAVGFTARDVGTFERLSVVVFDRRPD